MQSQRKEERFVGLRPFLLYTLTIYINIATDAKNPPAQLAAQDRHFLGKSVRLYASIRVHR
jgi:hypothetical protein